MPNPGKSRSNLRPPIKKGEVRNPAGHNGYRWLKAVRTFFKEQAPDDSKSDDSGETVERFKNVLFSLYMSARKGNPHSMRLIIESLAGKAKESVEITGPGGPTVAMWIPNNGRGPASPASVSEPEADEPPPPEADGQGDDEDDEKE